MRTIEDVSFKTERRIKAFPEIAAKRFKFFTGLRSFFAFHHRFGCFKQTAPDVGVDFNTVNGFDKTVGSGAPFIEGTIAEKSRKFIHCLHLRFGRQDKFFKIGIIFSQHRQFTALGAGDTLLYLRIFVRFAEELHRPQCPVTVMPELNHHFRTAAGIKSGLPAVFAEQ